MENNIENTIDTLLTLLLIWSRPTQIQPSLTERFYTANMPFSALLFHGTVRAFTLPDGKLPASARTPIYPPEPCTHWWFISRTTMNKPDLV